MEQSFVNLDLRIFPKDSVEGRKAIAEAAVEVLAKHFARSINETVCDISVQETEMERESYARRRSSSYESATTVDAR